VTRPRHTFSAATRAAATSEPESSTQETPSPETPASGTPAREIQGREHLTPETRSPETSHPIAAAPVETANLTLPGSRITAIAPLRGSHESLARQNEKTEADGLERILDDNDLHDRIARKMLVPVPASPALNVNQSLPLDRRYCRPWTAAFLTDLARVHNTQFHRPLEVNSAVRTVEYQRRLMEINGNAADAEGDIASPHLTGATIDIAKQGLSQPEIYWMRARLLSLQNEGKIDVEEEFHQACFHITVYKSYTGEGPAHKPHRRTVTPPADGAGSPSAPAEPTAQG